MSRTRIPTVPANYGERRIIALENFMLSTHLRGKAALAAFNDEQRRLDAMPLKPLIPLDPKGLKLAAYMSQLTHDIRDMRTARGVCPDCGDRNCVGMHRRPFIRDYK